MASWNRCLGLVSQTQGTNSHVGVRVASRGLSTPEEEQICESRGQWLCPSLDSRVEGLRQQRYFSHRASAYDEFFESICGSAFSEKTCEENESNPEIVSRTLNLSDKSLSKKRPPNLKRVGGNIMVNGRPFCGTQWPDSGGGRTPPILEHRCRTPDMHKEFQSITPGNQWPKRTSLRFVPSTLLNGPPRRGDESRRGRGWKGPTGFRASPPLILSFPAFLFLFLCVFPFRTADAASLDACSFYHVHLQPQICWHGHHQATLSGRNAAWKVLWCSTPMEPHKAIQMHWATACTSTGWWFGL